LKLQTIRIKQLDQLKAKLQSGYYVSANDFFEAFEGLFIGEVAHNRCERDTVNWQEVTQYHLELIDRVTQIHAIEETTQNIKALEETLSVELAMEASLDAKRGRRIYCLKAEDTKYDCVGDLHADPSSLMTVIKRSQFLNSALNGTPHRLVFMGDYVDRGKAHLATLTRLLSLKLCFPNRIFLIRGNHDGGEIEVSGQVKLPYRKPEEEPDEDYFPTYLTKLITFHPCAKPLLEAYLTFFNTLGQIAFIQSKSKVTMIVHGGVPRPILENGSYFSYLNQLSDLSDLKIIDPFGRTMVQNLMWSDPYNGNGDLREGMGRFYFSESQFLDFLETIGVHQMLRGHQAMDEGYRAQFQNRIYTIFSSGQWPGEPLNQMTAYEKVKAKWARITPSGDIQIHPGA
jgi:hypothetical protein